MADSKDELLVAWSGSVKDDVTAVNLVVDWVDEKVVSLVVKLVVEKVAG